MAAISSDAEDKGRSVTVKLTADVDDYVHQIQRATLVTSSLAKELRALGIAEKDMPDVIKGVIALAEAGGIEYVKAANIAVSAVKDYQLRNAG